MARRYQVFLGIVAGLALYTGFQAGRLFPGWPAAVPWALTAALFALMLGPHFLHRSDPGAMERPFFQGLVWTGSVALGVWATFILLSIPFNAAALLSRLTGLGTFDPRAFLALAAAAVVIGALGLGQAVAGPAVKEVTVRVPGLAAGLEGLRIAHISDLHIGPTIQSGYVERVVTAVQALKPDLIAVTGDLADGTVEQLGRHVAPLAALKAPLGVFFVTGNHEYYWGPREWLKKAAELGWTPLVDESRVVSRGAARVLVGGVADTSGPYFIPEHRSDPQKAVATEEHTDLKVLLAHRPDSCLEGEKAGFDLQLSGHTHGGQFFPFSLLIGLFHRYPRGLNRHGKLWLYVNSGTGYWGPPNRFRVPAEITLLRITGEAVNL